ncbi:MAG: amino acid carrier protein [Planctomycetota bacterium]
MSCASFVPATTALRTDAVSRRNDLLQRLLVGFLLACFVSISASSARAQSSSSEAVVGPDAVVATETTTQQTVAAESGSDSAPTTEPDAAEDAEDGGETKTSWMTEVDRQFGALVVDNVAAVLFFDFWTGQWLGTSIPFVVVWLACGAIFLTIKMQFINFRAFRHAIDLVRGVYDTPDEPGEVSHFQALSAALSGTVGLGNIAGVAIAIGTGGPGATFWIIAVGLLGMTSKFAECTLGQLYRANDVSGNVLGGPMRYLNLGLADLGYKTLGRVLSVAFMVLCICASFGGGNSFQIGQSLDAIRNDFPVLDQYPWIYGIVMVLAIGIVIVGGIKSIGSVAGRIVPFMCLAYMTAAIYILVMNASAVPLAAWTIVSSAFAPDAAFGGFLGVLVIGIKRAVFSNEAGVGSAAIAHSAAKTDDPVSEGIVALLEPFIDTVVVCTVTALVVVVTGVYADPAMRDVIDGDKGASLTLQAFVVGGHDWFRYVLYFAVVLFAYSTCISWSYYGERCWTQLFGGRSSTAYKIIFLGFTMLGSIVTQGNILAFSDLMLLGMSFPNLLGVFLLSGVVKRALDEYWVRYKENRLARADGTHVA